MSGDGVAGRFKENDDCVLLATDVAGRGLDIKDVKLVIHYQVAARLRHRLSS